MKENQLEQLVKAVQKSKKYRLVSPELIAAIGERELATRPSLKTAVKATKNKLHQVGGAYQGAKIDYNLAISQLRETVVSPADFQETCRKIMRAHISTRERLPIIHEFFQQTLADLPPIQTVMDLACGLNPLAWPWMPFGDDVTYVAYDIYGDQMEFIGQFLDLTGVRAFAEVRDIIHQPPDQAVDLALVLKTLPCLEQVEKGAANYLLAALQARFLLISYPVTSLGGRGKGMIDTYDAHFQALAAGQPWSVQRYLFSSELAFFIMVDN